MLVLFRSTFGFVSCALLRALAPPFEVPLAASDDAIQDRYPEDVSHCYGCGRLNPAGHQLRTYWDDGETISRFTPEPHHTAIPGFVYGGLIASLIDCHGTGTAAAAAARQQEDADGSGNDQVPRFVTASIQVEYVKPTPLGPELRIRGRVKEMTDRKVRVEVAVSADGQVRARGSVVAVRMPKAMTPTPDSG